MDYRLFPHQQQMLDKLKSEQRHVVLYYPRMAGVVTLRNHLDQALKKEPEQSK